MEPKKPNVIHYLVVAALCFLFRFVPPFAQLTPYGMGILGTFLGAVYGWTFIDMIYPSFMALVGIGLTIGMNEMMSAAWGTSVISMIFIYLVVGVCNETGAMDWLVKKLLSAKFMVGKPWIMVWFVMAICVVVGGLNSVVMIVIMLNFLIKICDAVGMKYPSKTSVMWALGCVLGVSLGQIMLPFMGLGLTLVMVYTAMFKTALEFVPWIITILPLNFVMITVYVLLMRFVFRCDVKELKNTTADMFGGADGLKATRDQKLSLIFFLGFMICMIFSTISALGVVYKIFSTLGMFGITAILLCIMMVVPNEQGGPLLNFRKCAASIGWEPVMLTAFIMVIGSYMNSADAGISASLRMLFAPLVGFSPLVFVIVALAMGAFITNFATNLIVIIIIMPVIVSQAAAMGMPMLGVLCLLFMSCHLCLMTPAASPQTGITFASPLIDKKMATLYGSIMVVLMFATLMIVGIPWINLVM